MNNHIQSESSLRGRIIPVMLSAALLLGGAGCGGLASNAAASEPTTAVSGCDASKVTVTQVHWFKDSGNAWRVVGTIVNHSSKAISKLVTGVETRTSADAAADQGEDISAYTLNLQPGEQAPYTAWIDREIPGLDHFEVEIAECVLAEPAERTQVDIRGGRVTVDSAGKAQVTAELSNPGSQAILINGLMAAVYDSSGVMITAQYANVTPRYLQAGETGPVRVTLDLPPGAGPKVNSYKIFMDALVNQPAPLPLNIQQDVKLLSHYVDSNGQLHLIGQITNSGTSSVMTALQATLFTDASKSQVSDAAQLATWVPLKPGETLPFDLADWGVSNPIQGLANTEDLEISLRLEPFLTWTTTASVKTLSLSDGNMTIKDQQAIFTGKVTNAGEGGITSGNVNAVLRNKSDGQVIAVGSAHLAITDSAAPGTVLDYSISVPLPGNVDPATLTTDISAKGYQP